MENLDGFGLIWTDLDEKVGCIKEKIFSTNIFSIYYTCSVDFFN